MSVLQYPDAMNGPDLQIWTNAAFDNEESETTATAIKASWSTLQSDLVNQSSDSFVSDYSKENLSLSPMKTPSFSAKSIKPLQPNTTILNSQAKPLKLLFKEGLLGGFEVEEKEGEGEKERDEKKIDSEIEEIQNEITRLSSRLEALRLEKAEKTKKTIEKRGRIVPAKFLEPKQSSVVKIDEALPPPPSSSTKPKLINRRGLSLGPSEIVTGASLRRLSKIETTPVQGTQSRRKSCFWKLQDIDELRVTKERGKSQSLSPKSRKTMSKTQAPPKQAATTVSSKRGVKKEEAVLLSSIQPKKLFKEGGEKSVTAKKPVKMGRFVASRYNAGSNDGRKRSLPENGEDDKDEGKRNDKRRMSFGGKQVHGGREVCRSQGTKKKWEIPSEVVVFHGLKEEEKEKEPALQGGDALPKIKTLRCVKESPRDSGPAKRVAELIGRKSYFCSDEEVEGSLSVCQVLSFEEEKIVLGK